MRLSSVVVLCCYNGEKYIEEQVASILEQKRPVERLYISDDGSTDRTVELIRRQFGHLPQLTIYQQPSNLGYIKNFESAVMAVSEDVLFFSDQDDRWSSSKTETILALFEADPELQVVFGDLELMDKDGVDLDKTLWKTMRKFPLKPPFDPDPTKSGRYIVKFNMMTGAAMALRTSFAQSMAPYPLGIPHDHSIAIRSVGEERKILALPTPLTWYRVHPGQTIGVNVRGRGKAELVNQIRRVRVRLDGFRAHRAQSTIINRHVLNGLDSMVAELAEEVRHLDTRLEIRNGNTKKFLLELIRGGYRLPSQLKTVASDFLCSLSGGK